MVVVVVGAEDFWTGAFLAANSSFRLSQTFTGVCFCGEGGSSATDGDGLVAAELGGVCESPLISLGSGPVGGRGKGVCGVGEWAEAGEGIKEVATEEDFAEVALVEDRLGVIGVTGWWGLEGRWW